LTLLKPIQRKLKGSEEEEETARSVSFIPLFLSFLPSPFLLHRIPPAEGQNEHSLLSNIAFLVPDSLLLRASLLPFIVHLSGNAIGWVGGSAAREGVVSFSDGFSLF